MLPRRALPLVVFAAALSLLAGDGGAQGTKAFKEGKANTAATCATVWKEIGQPRYLGSGTRNTTLVCHTRYFVSHNNAARTPDWVIERLTKAQVSGHFNRPLTGFVRESAIPAQGNPRSADYAKSDFALGHMAPSEDFNESCKLMRETFSYANAVPQVGPAFNGSIWAQLEGEVRDVARERGPIYVITGPVPRAGAGNRTIRRADNDCGNEIVLNPSPPPVICKERNLKKSGACAAGVGVAVPAGVFKIVYDPGRKTVYAYVLPNRDHDSGNDALKYLDGFRVTVAALTSLTGIEFLTDLPAVDRANIVNKCSGDRLWAAPVQRPKTKDVDCPKLKKK